MRFMRIVKLALKALVPYGILVLYHRYRQFRESRFIDQNILTVMKQAVEKSNLADFLKHWYVYSYKVFPERKYMYLTYKWIVKHIPAETPILEIACGIGALSHFLHRKGFTKLTGYDFDANVIDIDKYIVQKIYGGGGGV